MTPQEHFSSGVILYISDDEVENERFDEIYRIKWERVEQGTKSYRKKDQRAVIDRAPEGDGYRVLLYAEKRHRVPGVTVPQTMASTYSEILRQHGDNL